MGQIVSSTPILSSVSSLRVEDARLLGDCNVNENTPQASKKASYFPLDLVLGNHNGAFKWGLKDFSHSSNDIRLEGTVLHATLLGPTGNPFRTSIDLNNHFWNTNGAFEARHVPVLVSVPQAQAGPVMEDFSKLLEKPNLKFFAVPHDSGSQLWHIFNDEHPTVFKTHSFEATRDITNAIERKGGKIAHVEHGVLAGGLSLSLPYGVQHETEELEFFLGDNNYLPLFVFNGPSTATCSGANLRESSSLHQRRGDDILTVCKMATIAPSPESFGVDPYTVWFGSVF